MMIRDGSGKMKGRRNRPQDREIVDLRDVHFLDRETRRAIADNLRRVQRATDRAIFEELVMGRTMQEIPFT